MKYIEEREEIECRRWKILQNNNEYREFCTKASEVDDIEAFHKVLCSDNKLGLLYLEYGNVFARKFKDYWKGKEKLISKERRLASVNDVSKFMKAAIAFNEYQGKKQPSFPILSAKDLERSVARLIVCYKKMGLLAKGNSGAEARTKKKDEGLAAISYSLNEYIVTEDRSTKKKRIRQNVMKQLKITSDRAFYNYLAAYKKANMNTE